MNSLVLHTIVLHEHEHEQQFEMNYEVILINSESRTALILICTSWML